MDPERFDMMTRLLAPASRRQSLMVLTGIATMALVPVAPTSVLALSDRARRRCRKKDGKPLEKGTCHCGWHCTAEHALFSCHDNPGCTCYKDASGRGFCGEGGGNGFCTHNSDCDPGRRCALNTCAGNLCILTCST
jgi:hypothetical protein